jgi:DNA-directed RNA polymerase subunit M/transcription elongation factor TFIIS
LELKGGFAGEEEMRQLIKGVRCPKCGGNLYLDRDYIGWYEQCLQCSYMKDLGVVYQSKKKAEEKTTEPVLVKKRAEVDKKDTAPHK